MENLVVPHNPNWTTQFTTEAARIKAALGPNTVAIHHIGSTAIPDILAKPIIDILVEVTDIKTVDQNTQMPALGYEAKGEFGIKTRRYFQKLTPDGTRTHHVHIYEQGSEHIARHLAFRDYLRTHPDIATEYSSLKATLLKTCKSRDEYIEGKSSFVKTTEQNAIMWYAA